MADNDIATQVTNILTPVAVAQLGPLGALVVQLGVAATTAAIAKRRERNSVDGMTLAQLQQDAAELLDAPTFEQSVEAGQRERDTAAEDDGA